MSSRRRIPRKKPSRWPSYAPAAGLALATLLIGASGAIRAQERGPTPLSAVDLQAAIGKLGDLDYPTRMKAGRAIRRAPEAAAVPALLQAARDHADGYIRFKALILLTGFGDPRTLEAMEEALASPNDRLREVEAGLIGWALKVSGGNKSRAAELLQIKRSTLGDRINRCGLGVAEKADPQPAAAGMNV